MRILIIEDNYGDIYYLMEELQQFDFITEFTVIRTGSEAIAYLKAIEHKSDSPVPDIIILDSYIPANNGLEVLLYIKQLDRIALSNVVFYSLDLEDVALDGISEAIPAINIVKKTNDIMEDIAKITEIILSKVSVSK